MSQNVPNLLEKTISKVKEMVSSNDIVGDPIVTPDGVTILPVSRISVGFGGGGSDFETKSPSKPDTSFGGGAGGGVKISPVAFIIIKGDSVRLLPVPAPASSTPDRVVEMIPDVLDKISSFIDGHMPPKDTKNV